jgi:hypothetical protein
VRQLAGGCNQGGASMSDMLSQMVRSVNCLLVQLAAVTCRWQPA